MKRIDVEYGCLTTKRMPTRRGIIWLGQTCNFRCYFCYFANRIASKKHPEHAFFSLEKAKEMCDIFVNEFNLNSIDIQGGEPTIYPHILDLIKYCNNIGLKPTLITNGMALNNFEYAKKFKDAGVYDFLFSLQGIGDTCDRVVGVKGAFKKQMLALENISKLKIPLRINAVLSNEILEQLEDIAQIAIDNNARVVNFIGYNNTGDQEKLRQKHQIPYYTILKGKIEPIIERLEEKNIEVNLRFLPFCVVDEKFRKNIINSKQQIFDIHESEKISRFWVDRPAQRQALLKTEHPNIQFSYLKNKMIQFRKTFDPQWVKKIVFPYIFKQKHCYSDEYPYLVPMLQHIKFYNPTSMCLCQKNSKVENFLLEISETNTKIKPAKCQTCFAKQICDGFHSDFINSFGDTSIVPIRFDEKPSITLNPLYWNQDQLKFIEKQEWGWYFL